MSEKYSIAEVPKKHRDFRPKDNTSTLWAAQYEKCKKIVEQGGLILLSGTRGAGKTQMACSLIGYSCFNLDKSALYSKAFGIFLKIREGMRQKLSSELEAIQAYIKPFFLVIDAYEVRSDSPFENRTLDHIIDKRYDDCKSTLIITNDKLEDFVINVGPSIADRANETGGMCEFNWESFRK